MIQSMLDDDLYKIAMQHVVLDHYPNAVAEYHFTNRGSNTFSKKCVDKIKGIVYEEMPMLKLTDDEYNWLDRQCRWLPPQYLNYLSNYRFDPNEVEINRDNGDLDIRIRGPWHRTIRWEVPLMAIISESYFLTDSTGWAFDDFDSIINDQRRRIELKGSTLDKAGCIFADFGTRRRRSYRVQDFVVRNLRSYKSFIGTSNIHLAHKYGLRPIGTMAHEIFMAVSVLESLRHANRFTLQKWHETYNGNLGVALTDTFGTTSFFKDFDSSFARLFDGVRQDSGDPFEFGEKVIRHYQHLGIDPQHKSIVFSDGLDTAICVKLQEAFFGRIKPSFGIGTNLTNDFDHSPALNMVIKMWSVNDIPVVKLSDVPGKATGDETALKIARNIHLGKSL